MNHSKQISEALINAYIDDELQHSDRSYVLEAIHEDCELAQRVNEMRNDMDLLRLAYEKPPQARPAQTLSRKGNTKHYLPMLAASLLLLIGTVTGLLISQQHAKLALPAITAIDEYRPTDSSNDKILIHVNSFNRDKINAALGKAEQVLEHSRRNNKDVNLSIVANQTGLGMLREGSPYADRIHKLSNEHGNVKFLACGIAMQMAHLQEGREIKLLPDAEKIPAALSEILERIKQGWLYVKS